MDESTLHIHATVVPIVRGERRKANETKSGKKKYRKKNPNTARLCADDVMAREKLKEYQTTYAEAMAKYGLRRGIDGSEAKHITCSQFYKKVFAQQNTIKERVAEAEHEREKDQLKQETNVMRAELAHVHELFPHIGGLMRWEEYCRSMGLNKAWTKALFSLKPYRFSGELHSVRYGQTFPANEVILQFKPDKNGPGGVQFTINGRDGDEWFGEKHNELLKALGVDIGQRPIKKTQQH